MRNRLFFISALVTVVFGASCAVHQTDVPGLTGPSTVAHSLTITLSPTTISRDGVSTSQITVVANGPNGPESQVIRLEMLPSDGFGTLSARTITTGVNGVATATFTAGPSVPPPATPTIDTVSIRASLTGSDSQSSLPVTANIRLMPLGVIIPVGDAPTPRFTMSPPPVTLNIPTTFDASTSCPSGLDANNNCLITSTSSQAITDFAWDFGDGATANGKVVIHAFTTPGTYNVVLTVTNDRAVKQTKPQSVTIGASNPALGDWVFSPASPVIGDKVIFNADGIGPPPGRTLVQFSWNFGDDASGAQNTAIGLLATHPFSRAATFTVVLTVIDDTGKKSVFVHQVTVGSGNPIPSFTVSPPAPSVGQLVTFDASGTQVFGGASIVSYAWLFGDGGSSSSGPVATYTYSAASVTPPRTVTLTVVDSLGRRAVSQVNVTVNP
jgi:PKD repeat protein